MRTPAAMKKKDHGKNSNYDKQKFRRFYVITKAFFPLWVVGVCGLVILSGADAEYAPVLTKDDAPAWATIYRRTKVTTHAPAVFTTDAPAVVTIYAPADVTTNATEGKIEQVDGNTRIALDKKNLFVDVDHPEKLLGELKFDGKMGCFKDATYKQMIDMGITISFGDSCKLFFTIAGYNNQKYNHIIDQTSMWPEFEKLTLTDSKLTHDTKLIKDQLVGEVPCLKDVLKNDDNKEHLKLTFNVEPNAKKTNISGDDLTKCDLNMVFVGRLFNKWTPFPEATMIPLSSSWPVSSSALKTTSVNGPVFGIGTWFNENSIIISVAGSIIALLDM